VEIKREETVAEAALLRGHSVDDVLTRVKNDPLVHAGSPFGWLPSLLLQLKLRIEIVAPQKAQ
jgi:hypothetical protein